MKATKNRVLIRQETKEKTSAGGLILSTQMGKDHDRGVVVHVGAGVEGIAIGDTVILSHIGPAVSEDMISVAYEHIIAVCDE